MIDLSVAGAGELSSDDGWFSGLYVSAVRKSLTGGILVHGDVGDTAVFFRDGRPVHAAGAGFSSHYLGALLVEMEACTQAQVDAAVAQQAASAQPPLLGALLVSDAGVNPADVKRAIQRQNEARFARLFDLAEGTWQAAPGENARIRDIGVMTPGWRIFFEGLERGGNDAEQRHIADKLLGRAVQLKGGTLGISDFTPTPAEKKLVQYLEKPRKPDQLERALKNRRLVRGFLRALDLLDRLTVLPVAKAIAIPKATLLKGVELPGAEQLRQAVEAKRRADSAPPEPPPAARAEAAPKPKNTALIREVEALHASLDEKNHFEVLGASEKTPPAELRKLFTELAKKYHPDAFPTGAGEAVTTKAREISARINDAYQTLTNEERRREYLELLADKRIRGDLKRAELVREAEMKAKKGQVMLRKKEYKPAREFFKSAMELDPVSSEYKAHYAWTLVADPSYDKAKGLQEALPLVKQALEQAKESAVIHFYMAQIHKARGEDREALKHFKLTVRFDRNHADAAREMRLLEMRESKRKAQDDDKGGLMARFLKRKS